MITEGYLISVEQDGQKYIRSLNKTEQKNLNLKEAIQPGKVPGVIMRPAKADGSKPGKRR